MKFAGSIFAMVLSVTASANSRGAMDALSAKLGFDRFLDNFTVPENLTQTLNARACMQLGEARADLKHFVVDVQGTPVLANDEGKKVVKFGVETLHMLDELADVCVNPPLPPSDLRNVASAVEMNLSKRLGLIRERLHSLASVMSEYDL